MLYLGKTRIIAKKEIKSLISEKTLLLAVLIQLFIALFSSFLVIGLTSFYSPESLGTSFGEADIGIVGDENGDFKKIIRNDRKISASYFKTMEDAEAQFYNGKIDGVIVIPPTSLNSSKPIKLDLYLPKNDLRSTLVTVNLKNPLEDFEDTARAERSERLPPISQLSVDPPSSSGYFEFVYGLLIPLLMFTPAFISGGLIIDLITEEFDHKTMDLLLSSPITFKEILGGKILTATIISPLQALAWLVLLRFNGIPTKNPITILIFVTVLTLMLVLFGVIFSLQFKDRAQVHFMYSILLLLMFTLSSLMTNSPFNLIARLAIGSIGSSGITAVGIYFVALIPLYLVVRGLIGGSGTGSFGSTS